MKIIEIVKRILTYILVAIFWIGLVVTFVGGCFGTFFKSADDPNDDYEEYIHGTIP